MAYIPSSNSVVAFQSDATKLTATVSVVGINSGPSSVQLLGGNNVIGSVTALQGTNPWKVELTSGSVITTGGNSSVQIVGQTPPASVSGVGTFNVNPVGNGSIISTLINSSVTALQGTNPWVVSGTVTTSGGNSSVQLVGGTAMIGSVTAYQGSKPWAVELTSGSILTTVGNSSVQLVGGTAMVGSVAAYQGATAPWRVELTSGSVITAGGNSSVQVVGLMPPQSVSGVGNFNIVPVGSIAGTYLDTTVVTSVTGIATLFKKSDTTSVMVAVSPSNPLPVVGSVSGTVAVTQSPASVQVIAGTNVIGSVAVLQATNPWVVGNSSVTVNNIVTGNSSVYLIPGVGVLGSVAALQGTNPWTVQLTSGSIATTVGNSSVQIVGAVPTTSVIVVPGIGVLGSVATLQGTNPWTVQNTSGSIFAYQAAGSIMAVSATVNTGNSSVQLLGGGAAIGSVTALQGTNPWVTIGSVQGTVSVLGTVPVTQSGTWATSMVGVASVTQAGNWVIQPASVQLISTSASIAVLVNRILQGVSSVQIVGGIGVIGSVAALQGTNPWVIGNTSVQVVGVVPTTSVIVVPGIGVLGSVATLQGTNPWLINATNSSVISVNEITRNDKVASFLGVDLTARYMMGDAEGRTVVMPFAPFASSIFGHASTASAADAASVVVLAAAGTGLKNYVTDYQVFNTGANTTMVTFTEGGGSILGKTIAPAGGGSNMPGMNFPLKNQKSAQPINMVVSVASANVHVIMYGFTAP